MKGTIAIYQRNCIAKPSIKQAKDKRITPKEGAIKIGISERHFRRLLSKYRQEADSGLISGHRGKPGNCRLPAGVRRTIAECINDPLFQNFGPTLLQEKLEERNGISICKETCQGITLTAQFMRNLYIILPAGSGKSCHHAKRQAPRHDAGSVCALRRWLAQRWGRSQQKSDWLVFQWES